MPGQNYFPPPAAPAVYPWYSLPPGHMHRQLSGQMPGTVPGFELAMGAASFPRSAALPAYNPFPHGVPMPSEIYLVQQPQQNANAEPLQPLQQETVYQFPSDQDFQDVQLDLPAPPPPQDAQADQLAIHIQRLVAPLLTDDPAALQASRPASLKPENLIEPSSIPLQLPTPAPASHSTNDGAEPPQRDIMAELEVAMYHEGQLRQPRETVTDESPAYVEPRKKRPREEAEHGWRATAGEEQLTTLSLFPPFTVEQVIALHFCKFVARKVKAHYPNDEEKRLDLVDNVKLEIKRLWMFWLNRRITRNDFLAHLARFAEEKCLPDDNQCLMSEWAVFYRHNAAQELVNTMEFDW